MEFEPYLGQIYEDLRQELQRSGALFEDPTFGADETSIFQFKGPLLRNVSWKRPHEITSDPKFIENGISPNDLCQGQLGYFY